MKRAVLIGACRPEKLPALVAEYAIRRRTSLSFDLFHTFDEPPPIPKMWANRARTGFSFQRFTLPERLDYGGVGVYLDSDMFALADIHGLFDAVEAQAGPLSCTQDQAAVLGLRADKMLWQVGQILNDLDRERTEYHSVMNLDPWNPSRTISRMWNCLDKAPDGAHLVHYTDLTRQPWTHDDCRPVSDIFFHELRSAIASCFITREFVRGEIEEGHIHPSVLSKL